MQYVLQTSGYRYPKRKDVLATVRMLLGEGIVWVHGEHYRLRVLSGRFPNQDPGDQHQRHRKIMNPSFSVPQLKSFLPLFLRYANKVFRVELYPLRACITDEYSF